MKIIIESQDSVVGTSGADEGCKILVTFLCFAHSILYTDPDINQSQVFTPFVNNNENQH